MAVDQVLSMIVEALRAMVVGIPCVFLVLAIFYGSLRLLMFSVKEEDVE